MSETKIASAIALATLAGATYYVVKNWEFEGDDPDPDPQPQPQPEDERPELIDPLTLDENDSLKEQSGKTFTVENPLYNDRTKYARQVPKVARHEMATSRLQRFKRRGSVCTNTSRRS